MAIPAINVLGNPNVTEGNFQIAIEDLRKSVIGSGKAYDSANTYSQYDTCVSGGIVYYSKINSNTGNTPAVNANWGLIGDLFNLLITNGTAFGYGTGSGGTVTQLTSKGTAVTLNKPCGTIITSNSTLAPGSIVSFIVYNNLVTTSDLIYVYASAYSSSYQILVDNTTDENGKFNIRITNISGLTLSDSPFINFSIIKGARA